jgi:hypothetical protein
MSREAYLWSPKMWTRGPPLNDGSSERITANAAWHGKSARDRRQQTTHTVDVGALSCIYRSKPPE